jgi:photosystem II oxygen-evolving enhancer protein 3
MNATAMQTTVSQSAFVAARATARPARRSMVVRASAEESRRAVLGGLAAGVAGLFVAQNANAMDLFDDRKARKAGFDIIYEARDLDLDQRVRDGMTQARSSLADTKKRIAEAEKRIDGSLLPYVEKSYWTEARNELRRQVGTLRFDINAVADSLAKPAKKDALAAKAEFLAAVEDFDLSLRKKDQASASKKLGAVQSKLDAVIAKLG